MALNQIAIFGRMTRDPEKRVTQSGTTVTLHAGLRQGLQAAGRRERNGLYRLRHLREVRGHRGYILLQGQRGHCDWTVADPQLGGQGGQQAPLSGDPCRSRLFRRGQERQDGAG